MLHKAFGELGTEIEALSGNERLKVLQKKYLGIESNIIKQQRVMKVAIDEMFDIWEEKECGV